MKFYGMQKMTLLDYPGKVACTLFTGGCNFRCPFCHNARLVTEIGESDVYDETEILNFLGKRKGLLDGVCVTGGEPLLWERLPEFFARVKEMGFCVKLDTNGSFPSRLREIIDNKLVDYVAMDIKNCKEKYSETAGTDDFDLAPIEESVALLKEGRTDYEFRTTVVKQFHTTEDIRRIGMWIKGADRYFLQNFTDSGNLIGSGMTACDREELEKMRLAACEYVDNVVLRGI